MNEFLRRLSLPGKLMLIVLLPLAFLIFTSVKLFNEKAEKINILDAYRNRIIRSTTITNLVDELQDERRYTYGYVIKKDWQSQMLLQRAKTDEAYNKLLGTNDETLVEFPRYTMLNRLAGVRERVDQNLMRDQEVMDYFTTVIFRLNNINNISTGTISYLSPIRRELAGQRLLTEIITYLGILRASIYSSLYKKIPPADIAIQLHNLYDIYNTFQTEFSVKSSRESVEEYNRSLKRGDLRLTMQFIDDLINKRRIDSVMSADQWWTTSANGVDEVKALQSNLLSKIDSSVNQIYEREKRSQRVTIITILLILAIIVFIVTYTISVLNKMLTELNAAAGKISEGATGVAIDIPSNDVIGSLAKSIKSIDTSNKTLSDAAESIGKGNFDVVVTPRSSEDVLGNSIKRMKQELRKFKKQDDDKIWIHTGLEAINESVAGDKEVKQLSVDALNTFVGYIGCEVGLFYTRRKQLLEFTAGYAVPDLSVVPKSLNFGESLVGQVAVKKETVHLENIPDSYITIRSGTGEAQPRHVLILPLVHNNILEGVIEVASLSQFSQASLALAEQAKTNITIALQSAKSRARLQELLAQTQSQAEELRVQHNEMENLNAELEAQTQKLQASEEELKVQQEELLQTNQELEERSKLLEERNQQVIERNIEIQQKAKELELSTRYKSEFLANMSHELRTPLNSILLLSRLLSENSNNNLTEDEVEYAQVIQSSGNGLLALIDEILDLSKIEAGRMELDFSNVSVEGIAGDLRSLFTPIAREKGLDFDISVDKEVPATIETDKMRLEQVLKNLISNALKFTSEGSVKVQISSVPSEKATIGFVVKDTGIGIAKEKQQLIFEAFRQEDGSTRRKFGGTGLGLSISRELAKLLGGDITVTSEPGKGSEFTVHLPVEKATSPAKPQAEERTVFPLATNVETDIEEPVKESIPKYTVPVIPKSLSDDRENISDGDRVILIIEDDTNFAKALLDYTRRKGYKALVAVRGDEGIELAKYYKPLGILLDIQLPVKDGWEVMEDLKNNSQTRHIPVHIMSANHFKKESLQKGAIDFISKPVALEQMQEVFKKIEQVISKQGKKVLIVEENPKHAKALAHFLETFNVTAEISKDIQHGVSALKREDVDCVILDMGIPDAHAYATLEAVKKSPGLENLPIIIFTGKSLSKIEEQKIKQYADSIVIKTAFSYQRILDEVSLFLHLVNDSRQEEKTDKYQKLGALNEVLSNKTILIADDDVRNIFSLTKALEQHNMKVLTAMDGKEALRQLEEHSNVDIVLMDIMMPELDGYETTRRIRQDFKYRNLPIIAVTAKAMTGDREKCIQAGASDYISKPVDVDQLLSLLRVWLYERGI